MKTILIAAGLLLLYSASINAQSAAIYTSTEKESVPEKSELKKVDKKIDNEITYQTRQQFMRDFDNAKNTRWNVSKNFEEATFTLNGIQQTAYYDVDDKLVGTTTVKNIADIPAKAQEFIKKHYKNYAIKTVILFDDNEDNDTDMILYDTPFDDADNYFVALHNDKQTIIVKADMTGGVSFFKKLQ